MRLFFTLLLSILFINPVFSAVLEAGVSINEIPDDFFGSWRVNATLENTNSHSTFKPKSMDFCNTYMGFYDKMAFYSVISAL
jgi:hypothetical protein